MTRKKKAVFQIVLIICGIMMLCYGALRGEAETVLSKAIRLCLECVGIGYQRTEEKKRRCIAVSLTLSMAYSSRSNFAE